MLLPTWFMNGSAIQDKVLEPPLFFEFLQNTRQFVFHTCFDTVIM